MGCRWFDGRHLLALGVLLTVWCSGSPAFADGSLDKARDALQRGQYAEAERLAKPLANTRDDIDAKLIVARAKAQTGNLGDALLFVRRALASRTEDKRLISRATAMRGELEAMQGKYMGALDSWEQALLEDPDNRSARLMRGELLLKVGRKKEAEPLLDAFADDYNAGLLQDSRGLTMVGRAMWRLEYFEDANDVLQEATELDPGNVEALNAWGTLFVEKYNTEDAAFAFQSALKVNPNSTDALIGMVRVHMESDQDPKAIRDYLNKALAINPKHVDAIVLEAALKIDLEDYDGAIATLRRALSINYNHFEAVNLMATCHWLKDDRGAYERERRRAMKLNPRWAAFYNTVARFGVRVHRYQEAIDLNNQALKIDSSYWPAFVDLGIGYTRIGDDDKGFEYLLKAHKNDPFNVRAFNMVNLYEQTMPSYDFVERGPLRFRFHKKERSILEAVVPELAGEAFSTLKKRYKYTPKHKVSVEIFKDVETFSVRSVGLPHISPHGICFGRVVTSRSPSQEPFNWAEVIWHELAHVFHIQMSRSRVPRWFTEGLAEYEAGNARAEWRREQERELVAYMRDGRLWSVGELNLGFTQARTITDIINAYYQSTLVIEFIVDTYGFDAILKMLSLYGKSKSTPQALKAATRLEVPAFDAAFKKYLEKRFAPLLNSFDPNLARFTDFDRFEQAAKGSPRDAKVQAEFAAALFAARRIDEAEAGLKKALSLDPKQPLAHYLSSLYDLRTRNYAGARGHLTAITQAGHDGYALRLQLGEIARAEGKLQDAVDHYRKATTFYPRGIDAWRALVEINLKKGDKGQAAIDMAEVIDIDQSDFGATMRLLALQRELGDPKAALDAGLKALNISPFNAELQTALGELGLEAGKPAVSVRAYQMALDLVPGGGPQRAALFLGLARARHAKGDRKGAREAFKLAETSNPGHPDIEAVRKLVN